jgi:hypothetical protein
VGHYSLRHRDGVDDEATDQVRTAGADRGDRGLDGRERAVELRLDGAILAIPDPPTDASLTAGGLDESSKADALDVPDRDHTTSDRVVRHRPFSGDAQGSTAECKRAFHVKLR